MTPRTPVDLNPMRQLSTILERKTYKIRLSQMEDDHVPEKGTEPISEALAASL